MNIAFFGTSDKSTPILEALKADKDFDLTLCITKEDTIVGRKEETRSTQVKLWAQNNNINCVTLNPTDKNKWDGVEKALSENNIQLGVVADFGFILPGKVLNKPEHGLINIHFSLLPKLRGASPVQHAILNQCKETGITYYLMDKGMDTGAILYQLPYSLIGTETSESLYKNLFELAAAELPPIITKYVAGELLPIKQDENRATYCYSKTQPKSTYIYKEDAQINWQASPASIDAQIRAFNPWPIAWTTLSDFQAYVKKELNHLEKKVKIYEAEIIDGKLNIKKLQVEGGKVLTWKEFENGYGNKLR